MQVLEGGRNAVNALYNRIAQRPAPPRRRLLSYEEIGERSFAGWSMGQVNMDRLNPALLLQVLRERASSTRTRCRAQASLALFNELVATASIGVQG